MKGEYRPESTSFKALLNDLEEHDPDTGSNGKISDQKI
jgi:hypothetical protein